MLATVQSYDLLQNEKYGRLDDLKEVLESTRLDQWCSLFLLLRYLHAIFHL